MAKIKAIEYSRTFSSENVEPRKRVGKFEPERISVTLEAEATDENPEALFLKAYTTVYDLRAKADQLRSNHGDIEELEIELEELNRLIKLAPDSKKLMKQKESLEMQIAERLK